jgi:hypothetical protein
MAVAILKKALGKGGSYLAQDTDHSLYQVLLGFYNYALAFDTAIGSAISITGIDGTYGTAEATVLGACRTKMNAVAALSPSSYILREAAGTSYAKVLKRRLGSGGGYLSQDVENSLFDVLEALYRFVVALDATFVTIDASTIDNTWGQQECDVLTDLRTKLNAAAAISMATYLSKEVSGSQLTILKRDLGSGGGYLPQDTNYTLYSVISSLYDYFKALDTALITVKTGTISNSSYDAATEAVLDNTTNGVVTIINTLATLSLATYITKE